MYSMFATKVVEIGITPGAEYAHPDPIARAIGELGKNNWTPVYSRVVNTKNSKKYGYETERHILYFQKTVRRTNAPITIEREER